MAIYTKSICALGFAAILGACAQPEPVPIAPEPIFNKYGEATACIDEGGRITEISPTYTEQTNPCEPPECVDEYITGGPEILCQPPGREREGDDGRTGGTNPTGGARTP